MLTELQSLRVVETHFGVDVKTDPDQLARVCRSLFVQFDRDSNRTIDLEEFKAETKRMMLAMANDLGFLPVQMLLEEDSLLKKAVDRELTKVATSGQELRSGRQQFLTAVKMALNINCHRYSGSEAASTYTHDFEKGKQ